jgi:hypothetical protein
MSLERLVIAGFHHGPSISGVVWYRSDCNPYRGETANIRTSEVVVIRWASL